MEIIVNISALKEDYEGVSINDVKSDLIEFGAIVRGAKDVDGDTLMLINGDITVEDVENAFINIGVNVNDYIVEEDDLTITQTFEKNVTVKKNQTAVNEKKGSCCPPKKANGEKKVKKEYKGDLVNLSEALHGTHKRGVKPELKLNQIIDAIAGCHIDESISARAIEKAKQNNKRAYLQEKLGAEVYNAVLESLENGTTVHANKKINGKAVCEYSTDELKGLMEKASKQIEALEKKLGLNEADDAELTKKIAHFKDAVKMIDEEISFREAKELLSEGDGIEFKNINPNVSDDDKKKEEKKDEEATVEGDGSDEVSDEDDAESTDDKESEDDADDKEQNPDEDEEVELASIIITLATKDDAEDLKADFIEAGIPEDAIELEEVADDDEEDDAEDGESTEETDTENASEETAEETEGDKATEESVQFKGVKQLNEDDDNADDAETTEDDSTEETTDGDEPEDGEESEDEEAEKAWKVILVNTDYAKEAKDVLVDMWGMTEEEFNDMIGGDIVDDEDNAEDDGSDESSDNDDDSTKSDDENGESDDDDFDPNDIFANF